jgi:hypothetical protein
VSERLEPAANAPISGLEPLRALHEAEWWTPGASVVETAPELVLTLSQKYRLTWPGGPDLNRRPQSRAGLQRCYRQRRGTRRLCLLGGFVALGGGLILSS